MIFRLRYLQHDLELGSGDFVIGRSPDCQLALDDALVSRRHAVLTVRSDTVTVQDLGSRNGVLVNGARVEGQVDLSDGDLITIGSQKLTLSVFHPTRPDSRRRGAGSQTLSALPELGGFERPSEPPKIEGSKRIDAIRLLSSLADKALALGRADEAERILSAVLAEILTSVEASPSISSDTLEQAARYGVRLASATGKASWADYIFKLYRAVKRPCPAAVIDELFTVLRKIKGIDITALRGYVALMQDLSSGFGPAEKFLVQRLEGLERLAALQ